MEPSDAGVSPDDYTFWIQSEIQKITGWDDLRLHRWWKSPNQYLEFNTPKELARVKRLRPILEEHIRAFIIPSYKSRA